MCILLLLVRYCFKLLFQTFFALLSSPLPLPPNNPENQNFEKLKKSFGDLIIVHLCTKTHNHMTYASWGMEWNRQFFVILGHFFPYTPLLTQKIIIWKNVKNTWRYYPFTNVHHKWRSYVWFLRLRCNRQSFFSFWGIFYTLTLLNNPKNQNFEKMKKKLLEILSFNMSVLQIIIWCMIPEIWSVTVWFFCHFWLFFVPLPTNNLKNQNVHMCNINENHVM